MYFLVPKDDRPIVIVVGGGVVGSSILKEYMRNGYLLQAQHKINWRSNNISKINSIFKFCEKYSDLFIKNRRKQKVLIWTAGSAGFEVSQEDAEDERIFYESTVELLESEIDIFNEGLRIFLISSIGGLFEGQQFVSEQSTPSPMRAYGRLKMSQETFLLNRSSMNITIFRLSSVYSYIIANKRMGLLQTLIHNGLRREMTSIYGSLDTLRDYVWADDIAKTIYNVSQHTQYSRRLFHLVSGRPMSIKKMKDIIEGIIKRPLLLNYRFNKHNSLNICCVYDDYIGFWKPSDITLNLKKMYNKKME